ncbi:MAG: TonB-dependent receptor, partial [Azonexus sp.]|nr:TonB-dependent receptor [Azonexus sp.]
VNAELSWQDPQFAKDWSLSFDARFLHLSEEFSLNIYPPGARLPTGIFPNGMIGNPSRWQKQYGLSSTAQYTGFNNHRLRMGAGHDVLDLYKIQETKNFTFVGLLPTPLPSVVDVSNTSPYVFPYKRQLNYLYLQDEWTFAKDWALTAGIRYDHYSDFGATTNPRLALVWNARHDLTAKVMYGTAFRAPSINESASVNNPVAVGNRSLQAETIETLEAGVAWQVRPDTQINLSLFTHRLTDIIRLTANPVAATGKTYQNTGEQTGNGGELEITWDATKTLRLSGNYAYQKNIDKTTQHDAGYTPHHLAYARADWRFTPGWQLNGQLNHVADRKRTWGDSRAQIPDYTTVDLTLRTQQTKKGWDFAASVRNLFDADVREPSQAGSGITDDLPMPGRTFWLQARYGL